MLLRFHVFGIGQRTVGFSVRIEVKTGSKVSVSDVLAFCECFPNMFSHHLFIYLFMQTLSVLNLFICCIKEARPL